MSRPPTSRGRPRETLVIGVGNDHRGDDRCGLEVVRALRGRVASTVRLEEAPDDATSLLDLWTHVDEVVVVDAVRSGSSVGTVHRLEIGDGSLPSRFATTSTHSLGLADAIELGRALGRLPRRLTVFGIEAGEIGMETRLSPPVERAVATVTRTLLAELSAEGRGARTGLPG
jgi:hydrogenase maturation protease